MPSFAYDEDTDFTVEVTEDDISDCDDIDELLSWSNDADAVMEDIKAQIIAKALAGNPDKGWVYRTSKAMGYMNRAKSRIKARLKELGHVPAERVAEIGELHRRLAEAKAREAVAVEFLRLCQEGALQDRDLFHRVEAKALAIVDAREADAARRLAKGALFQGKAA